MPPCQNVNPHVISEAVNARLRSITSEDISAVIAVYKPNIEMLNNCIECIQEQVAEVIIVGDLDTPWPLFKFSEPNPKVKFVRLNKSDSGYGRKVNFGARHSNGAFLWTINDDCEAQPDVAEKMMEVMRSDSKVGIVSHLLRYPHDNSIQYAGKARPPGARGFGHLNHREQVCRITYPIEQESVCGCSILLRRKAFYEAGAMDERYRIYAEDDDLALSVRQKGWKVMFTPHATGYHAEHASTSITPKWRETMESSNRMFADKWKGYFEANPDPSKLGTFDYLKK